MVLANDFSGDEKSDPGPNQAIKPRFQQPYSETDFNQSTILASSYDDSESYVSTLPEDRPPDYSTLTSAGKGLSSVTRTTSDGRLDVSLRFKQTLPDLPKDYAAPIDEFAVDPTLSEPSAGNGIRAGGRVPQLNIVVMLVGSHGDVGPHLALGQELSRHGHRVRIATHSAFKGIVSHAGLEFFDIGGNPDELMGHMMRSSGLVSGFVSLNRGHNRRSMKETLDGCWRACTQVTTPVERPFIADAIIANPPSFAHVHCAEALGIPVHITSAIPWSPTTAFPHPLVNISNSNGERRLTNYLSYALAEMMIWQGAGDIINNFRRNTLGLKRLNMRTGAGILDKLKIPCTYAFSEGLVPKPEDWRNHIDVAGFSCQEQDTIYTPSPELIAFISEGPPPIYVNFDSAPIPDPLALTRTIIESTRITGTRVLIAPLSPIPAFPFSSIPSHAFLLPPGVPASALLPYTCAALHTGEARLTAAVLHAGKPSVVVPCVGDQTFWAWTLHRAGVAARPVEKGLLWEGRKATDMSKGVLVLKGAIEVALSQPVVENAIIIGNKIGRENGTAAGVHSFHRHLPLLHMRCDLFPERLAVWWSPKHYLRLSAFAAQILAEVRLLDIQDLRLHRAKEYIHDPNFADPISGGVVEVFRSVVDFHVGIAQIFSREPVQGLINTGVALPRGVFYSIDSIQEGIHHTPRLWGSKTRAEKPINDWKDGMAEGGKALFHGVVDGIAGLVTEPIDGYKNEGTIGALKGTGRGLLNVGLRPAAGSLALVTKPVKGAFFSIMSSFTPSTNTVAQLRSARIVQGIEHSALASDTEKLEVVKRWQSEALKVRLKERRKDWRKAKEEEQDGWILRSEHTTGGSGGIVGRKYTAEGSPIAARGHEHGHARTYSGSSSSAVLEGEWGPVPRSPMEPPAYEGVREYAGEKVDVERQRILELEQAIAEAERRGFERGLEEAAAATKGKQKASLQ